nr:hypothetical protein [Tanacetum cinerariifolium]
MDSQSAPVVSATKLPILNPNEFDLWKMRIEQYFLMTNYSPWEVIINEDSPAPTIFIDGVVKPATLLSADQKLAKRNELKARGTLLMALPDKHQLKFNSHKDAKTLMEAIEKRFGGNTKTKKVEKTLLKQQFENFTGSSSEDLDQIHDRLQKLVSQLEIHGVSLYQEDVNLKFLRSLPSEWKTHTLIWRNKANLEEHSLDDLFNISAAISVFAVCAKFHVSSHLNIDSLSNAIIFSFFASQSTSHQLDNEDLKQIDVDDLEEMDLKWHMAMLTMRARRFLQKTGRNLGDNRECRSPKDTRRTGAAEPQRRHVSVKTSTSNALVSQCDGIKSYDWSYQTEDEPANFALMDISSSSSASDNESGSKSLSPSSLSNISQPSGEYHVVPPPITRNFMPPKPHLVFHTAFIAVETAHLAFTVQLSPAKPAQDISYTTRPMEPIIEDWVSDSNDESDLNDPQSVPSFVQTSEHVKPSGYFARPVEAPILATTPKPTSPKTNCSSKRKNRKTCFMCKSVNHLIKDCYFYAKPKTQPTPRNYAHRGYDKQYASSTKKYSQKHIIHVAVLTKSKPIYVTVARPVSAAVPKIMVTKPRHAYSFNIKSNSIIRSHKTRSHSSKTSNSSPKVTAVKALVVSVVKGKKGKWVWRPKCSILDHDSRTTGNMSYLFDFQELNGGYVAFGGNPKGGKISGKGKIKTDFKLPDESQVLLRVPRENNMYNVNLKDIVPFGKFEGKDDEGFLVRYSMNSKAFRVFNSRTRIVQETLHVNFLENKPNIAGTGPTWLFDIDSHTRTMNYQPVTAGNQSNPSAGFQEEFKAKKAREKATQQYMIFPVWSIGSLNLQNKEGDVAFDGKEHDAEKPESAVNLSPSTNSEDYSEDSRNNVSAAGPIVPTTGQNYSNSTNPISADGPSNTNTSPTHRKSSLQDASQPPEMLEKEDIAYSDHENVGAEADFNNLETSITFSPILTTRTNKDHPVAQIIGDLSSTTQTRNTTRVIRDQGHTQKEGIDYEEVFVPVVRIEAIRLFLAYASFMGFMVYQMDVKSSFLYETIKEEVYVCQPPGFEDPDHPNKVYKVVKALYGLYQTPRACQDKYVAEILKKFGLIEGKLASTPIDIEKPLLKDPNGEDVDGHIYRSMIGSLMYLTSSRPDIMFAVCACARFQVTPKASHLHAVKRIFRYLKGKSHLGLWYLKDSPFDLVAYSDSDYDGASLDRKSTTGGCQFLGYRLIS